MKRRTFLKRLIAGGLVVLGLSGGTYFYARKIEPSLLGKREEIIRSPKIPTSFHNYKIIQFTDTHIGFQYTIDQLKELVKKINNERPDMILFTGDLVDSPQSFDWDGRLIQTLKSLQADDGKFWVYGNHDHGGFGTEKINNVLTKAGFTLLQNETIPIEKENEHINLAGLDDVMLGKPDLDKTFHKVNTDLFTMLLVHEPDYAEQTISYPVDIQLSGHSHGGQVRFPFLGHLYTPKYAEKYAKGKFQINDQLTLHVSKGIGTTRLPYRFLCKPEFDSYTLKHTSEEPS